MESLILLYGIDIALIAVLAVSVISSMRKGFLRCIFSIICVVISVAVAMSLSLSAAEWSYDNILSGYVTDKVEEAMQEGIDSTSVATTVNQIVDEIPDWLKIQLEGFGIDVGNVTEDISSLKLSVHDTAEKISHDIIRPGALVLLRMLCFILIYLAARFVLGLLAGVVCGIAKLPVLKQANKWLGAATGLIKGVVLIFLLSTLLNGYSVLQSEQDKLSQAVENSAICNTVKNLDITDLSKIDLYSITE